MMPVLTALPLGIPRILVAEEGGYPLSTEEIGATIFQFLFWNDSMLSSISVLGATEWSF